MRELSAEELDSVNGGLAWVLVGALGNGVYSAINACVDGGSVGSAFAIGFASGALGGLGIGLLGKGVQVAGHTLKSVTAGVTSLGAGAAVNTLQ